jgi:hypothetical protein
MPRTHDVGRLGADPPVPGNADVMIGTYLDELAVALIGPSGARAAVVAEISDGLLETVGSYRTRGLKAGEAVHAAIAEFGEPRTVAAAFSPEIGARQARRTAVALMTSGPLVGLAWIAGAVLAALPPVRHGLTGPWWALSVVGLALVVAAPSMLLVVVATGRAGLRFVLPPSLPPMAAGIAGVAALIADGTLLMMLGFYALTTSAPLALLPMTPAIAASLVRLALAAGASRRCLIASALLA